MSDSTELVELGHGDKMVQGFRHQSQPFGEKSTRHHRPFFEDYSVSKSHILQAIGDYSGCRLMSRQCLVAVFVKPNITPGGIWQPLSEVKNDWWENKTVLLLAHGPDAFHGDDAYYDAMFGIPDMESGGPVVGSGRKNRPRIGEWLYANASEGLQTSLCGEGASRPQGTDRRGDTIDLYEWDGWPCRIIPDDRFLQWVDKPHHVI